MDLSLDNLKETFFDYNSDVMLDIYDEIKEKAFYNGLMLNSESSSFLDVILNNIIFLYDYTNDDDDFLQNE
tara:strand:+ start:780 stop:992 length:213 start_codon:yes stop_codon:yes gene_type:complete